MSNYSTYNQTIDILKDIARRHFQINTFFLGKDYDLENDGDILFPLFQVHPTLARMPRTPQGDFKTIQINMLCKVVDLVQQSNDNEKDVHSDTLQIAQDIINEINQNPYFQSSNVSIINDITLSNLVEFQDDYGAGWEFDLTLQLINNNTFCGLPFDPIEGVTYNGAVSTGYTYTGQFDCDSLAACPLIIDLDTRVTDLETIVYQQNQLLSGSISYLSGLTFDITPLVYLIDGTIYNITDATQVTVGSGDTTYDRIDTIYADINGNTGVIAGEPSDNPVKPSLDPSTQIEVSFVSIPAGGTAPAITSTLVFDEAAGIPSEWYIDSISTPFVITSTTQSYTGTKSIRFSAATTSKLVEFSSSTVFDTSTQNTIQFAIKNTTAWASTTRLNLNLLSASNVVIGGTVQLYNGLYGFSTSNITSWQIISIPVSTFALSTPFISKLRFTSVVTAPQKMNIYLDKVQFVTGLPVVTSIPTWRYMQADSGAVLGAPSANSTLRLSGGTNITSVASGTNNIRFDLDPNIRVTSLTATTISATTYLGIPSANVNDTQVAFGSGTTIVSSPNLTYTTNPSETFFNLQGNTSDVKYTITNNRLGGGYSEIWLNTDIGDTRFGSGGSGTTPYGGNAGDSYFGNVANYGLILATNNQVRAYLKNTGEFGINTLQPKRQFHQNGGKFLVESNNGSYGQFQVVNPTVGEVTLVLAADATVNAGGTLTGNDGTSGDTRIWAYGLGSYGYSPDNFIIGNNYINGYALKIAYDGSTTLSNTLYSKDIVVNTGKVIKSANGGGELSLDAYGTASDVLLSIDNSGWNKSQLYLTDSYIELSQYDNNGNIQVRADNIKIRGNNQIGIGNQSVIEGQQIQVRDNLFSSVTTAADPTNGIVFINSNNGYCSDLIANSVVLGGIGLSAITSNTVYVPYLNIKNFTGTTAVAGLAIDADGNVVTGSTGSVAVEYWTSGSTGTYSIKANNDSLLDATGDYSVAEGFGSQALGYAAHAEGNGTTASGQYGSHSEGSGSRATGESSHAEGVSTLASAYAAHAEGSDTTASAGGSHAEGVLTTASGAYSHSEGYRTTGSGSQSHAGGSGSTASGISSFVHGSNSKATGNGTIVLGNNITGNTANTTYVNLLNIKNLPSGASIINLGLDASGNVVTGSTSTDINITGGTYSNGTTTFRNNTGGTFTVTGLTTPFTGGTVTGDTIFTNGVTANTYTVNPVIGLTATTAQTINLALSDHFSYVLSGNTTFNITNNANGKSWYVGVSTTSTTGLTSTFSATPAIKWPYSITPVQSTAANKTDVYQFIQLNGVIYGNYAQQY